MTRKILGISPSTRMIGIALLSHAMLDDWQVKSFKPIWSEEKLKDICTSIETYINDFQVTHLAVKLSTSGRSAPGIRQLTNNLERFAKERGLSFSTHTLSEIKISLGCDKHSEKSLFMKSLCAKYPELQHEFEKEHANSTTYYTMFFEAVGIANLVQQQADLNFTLE